MKTEMDLIAEEVLEFNASNTGPKLLIPGCFTARAVKVLMKRENGLIRLMDSMMYDLEEEMEKSAIEGLEDDDKSVAFHAAAMNIGAKIMYELEIRAWFAIKYHVDALKKAAAAASAEAA
jgi:hypothetical protein